MTSSIRAEIFPDDAGTYFERHEDYERRLRENSHRWFVPRMVPFALQSHKRLVVVVGFCSAMTEIAMLGYLIYLMADGELFLILSHVAKVNAIVAGTGLILVGFGMTISVRMPICVIYIESILILGISLLHAFQVFTSIASNEFVPDHIMQAWTDATAEVHVQIERRYSCSGATSLCVEVLVDRFRHHQAVMTIMHSVVAALLLLMGLVIVRLGRSISKQASFRFL